MRSCRKALPQLPTTARLVGATWLLALAGTVAGSALASASGPGVPTIYVADLASAALTPVNSSSRAVGPAIELGGLIPSALATTPNGRTVYAVVIGSDEDGSPGSVIPITTATNTLGKAIAVGTSPQAIAITPNGSTAYVLNGIDAATTPLTQPVTITPISLSSNSPGKALK